MEALAQIRDRVDVMARGMRVEGKPSPFPRPGQQEKQPESVDLSDPTAAKKVAGFFRR